MRAHATAILLTLVGIGAVVAVALILEPPMARAQSVATTAVQAAELVPAQAAGTSEHANIAIGTTATEIRPDSGKVFTSYRCTLQSGTGTNVFVGDSTVTTVDYGEAIDGADPIQGDIRGEHAVLAAGSDTLHCRFKVTF